MLFKPIELLVLLSACRTARGIDVVLHQDMHNVAGIVLLICLIACLTMIRNGGARMGCASFLCSSSWV